MNRLGRTIAVCALAAATAGCAAPYYWQAIGGQLELLRKREPIEEVIADASTDPKLKATLARIETMRRFAVDELKLPSNDSYTTYVALDRPYAVWNVVATAQQSHCLSLPPLAGRPSTVCRATAAASPRVSSRIA